MAGAPGSGPWAAQSLTRRRPRRGGEGRVLEPQKVKAYTTPTTTMLPSVAMMAIQSKTASLEDRGGSSGWPWPPEAAWTLGEELKSEYSVLKSSLGESMKAPPIMGSWGGQREN